jgi:hypothetical protein
MGIKGNQESITQHDILLFLQEQKTYLHKEFGVTKIALFGSYARGQQTKESDIDILIETFEHDFTNRLRLKEFLEKRFDKKVDVVYFSSVRKFIMRSIKEDLLYV